MTKQVCIPLAWLVLTACSSPPSIAPALRIAGTYKFAQYDTAIKSDRAPVGLVTLVFVDEQHVDLTIKGTSGKSKIVYSYRNVQIADNGYNYLGEDTFSLIYKKNKIGLVDSDEQGHYISLTLKPYVTLVASLPQQDD